MLANYADGALPTTLSSKSFDSPWLFALTTTNCTPRRFCRLYRLCTRNHRIVRGRAIVVKVASDQWVETFND